MKRSMFTLALVLLPTVAMAQPHIKVDCMAYHKNDDGLWAVTRANVIILDGKSIPVDITNACCYGSDKSRWMLGGGQYYQDY
jgi:hypothetical protein